MNDFMERILGKNRRTASQAKERLKLVLVHDRTNLTSNKLEALKDELISVISRYVEIDTKAAKILMEQQGREQRLKADIPIRPTRHVR